MQKPNWLVKNCLKNSINSSDFTAPLPLKFKIDNKICLTVFNCLNDIAPQYLQMLLLWKAPLSAINCGSLQKVTRRYFGAGLVCGLPFLFWFSMWPTWLECVLPKL